MQLVAIGLALVYAAEMQDVQSVAILDLERSVCVSAARETPELLEENVCDESTTDGKWGAAVEAIVGPRDFFSGDAAAYANQHSQVIGNQVIASGSVCLDVRAPATMASMDSRIRVRFAALEELRYQLTGVINVEEQGEGGNGNVSTHLRVVLNQIAGDTVHLESLTSTTESSESLSLDLSGTLPVGVYEFWIVAQGEGENDAFSPSFFADATFVVFLEFEPIEESSVSDLDRDGDTDLLDLAQFMQAFTGPQ